MSNDDESSCSISNLVENRRIRREIDREEVNLEPFQLIWLDPNVTHNDLIVERFRQIIDYIKIFHNIEDCSTYLDRTKNTCKTFLLSTEELAQQLFSQTSSDDKKTMKIYLYAKEQKEEASKDSDQLISKDKVYHDLDILLTDFKHDVQQYVEKEKRLYFLDWTKTENSMDNQYSSWWAYLIKLLSLISYPSNHREIFIETLKDYYKDNENRLDQLERFQLEYQPKDAILWYTRNTFVFRLLNQSARRHNIEMMFLFGFYLRDLYEQMIMENEKFKEFYREKPIIKLYRGQKIRFNELEAFKVGQYIANNRFLSTTFDRSVALFYLPSNTSSITDGFHRVLFELEIDVRQRGVNPDADISYFSQFSDEREVLFMAGSRFRISGKTYDHQSNLWIVQLKSAPTTTSMYLKDFDNTNYTQRRSLKNYMMILIPGMYLAEIEDINLVFRRLIDLFPEEENWITALKLHCLALHTRTKLQNIDQALLLQDQSIQAWQRHLVEDKQFNCSINIAHLYSFKTSTYRFDRVNIKKYSDLSISYYKQALENDNTDGEKVEILERLACELTAKAMTKSEQNKEEYIAEGIKYQQMVIQIMSKYNFTHIKTGHRFEALAKLYQLAKDYDSTLKMYQEALRYYTTHFKTDINQIGRFCSRIIDIYINHKRDYLAALEVQRIRHQYTLEDCQSITIRPDAEIRLAYSHEKLADFHTVLNEYHFAIEHLSSALNLNEEINCQSCPRNKEIAGIEIKLGDIHLELQQYDMAYNHLKNALKTYRTLRKESSTEIADVEIQSQIENLEQKTNGIKEILLAMQADSFESNP